MISRYERYWEDRDRNDRIRALLGLRRQQRALPAWFETLQTNTMYRMHLEEEERRRRAEAESKMEDVD